jgi:quinol monooxygenase YgiN
VSPPPRDCEIDRLPNGKRRVALRAVGGPTAVLVAKFTLAVKSEKRAEFLSAITGLIDRTLRLRGCSACRLSADCSDADGYFLISEWQNRGDFVAFTASRELYVLCGMRGLLSAEPYVVVDEVRRRTEGPLPELPRGVYRSLELRG